MTDQPALNTGSHDLPVSPALASHMTGQWAATPLPADGRVPGYAHFPARRDRLAAAFPGERLLVPAGQLKVRSNDCDHRFRPHSAYAHLTGLTGEEQVGHVLVIEPDGEPVLHVRPRSDRSGGSDEFYRDRRYGEFWVGRRADLGEAARLTGLRTAHLDDLPELFAGSVPTRLLSGVDPVLDALAGRPPAAHAAPDGRLATALSELRLVKDAWEVEQLQLSVDHTTAGFADVVRALPTALRHHRGERVLEGAFNARARAEGNGTGYETIVASGAHACVLHWTRNDGPLDASKLLLLDAGVETDTLYTADITRTLPLSGTFTPAQRDVYQLVLAAQDAAIATLRPGASFRAFHRAGMRVIAEGLAAWGLLPVPAEEALREDSGLYRRYTLCGSGHMLGLDVHDCAKARAGTYLDGVLEEGMVLTVEPGLYLQPDDLTLPPELRGLGVRIEDDLVITSDGARLMSHALPREPDAVESWMGDLLG
ncbi:aminopeptidase P family protein [Kitasatospora fiedleri]|uniref:aminopeptidase P family protein n=1 Tax=Kitasatospora fiedleri TaxID=2991545 RepID=UPI00249B7A2D|nr:aminopeptidase P family protein [Kitasatospora fiedleri]